MTDNVTIITNSKTSQEQARHEFEREWAVHVGFDLPIKVGDAWWPLTAPNGQEAFRRWQQEGIDNGWVTIS